MRATGLMTELSLGPLEAADTARLAARSPGWPLLADDVNLLQATTGGFPLYVIEAVRGGADPGGVPGLLVTPMAAPPTASNTASVAAC